MRNLSKGKTLSLVASGIILSSTMAFGANTIDEAFKEGTVSGALGVYGVKVDAKDNNADSGYGNANATVAFETASIYGISAKAEFKGNLDLGEVENNDRENGAPFENNSLMTEAYLKYATEGFSLTAGRQAIDLEWLGDYNEAVVASITAIQDTTVVLGFTSRKAESGIDLSEDFSDINGDKGVYVFDAKYAGLEGVEFNPYAYRAPDVADWYGLKTTFNADNFGVVAHYALSSEDTQDDGSIGHLELNGNIENLSAAVGYIKTDKDVGAGNIAEYGDNISPFEEGEKVYNPNAKTTYASIGYTIADVELGALYGETKYEDEYKEKELNLSAAYSITGSLGASILYADIKVDKDNGDFDYNKVLASVEYTF
ncbi:MAG: Opr family porin [Aliarcobacter sp.]|nr:Opr family porin [Aliarcobacter sp.]